MDVIGQTAGAGAPDKHVAEFSVVVKDRANLL